MGKRAAIWLAVSSKRQAAADRISLEYQEERAREWCAQEGYEIVKVFEIRGHSRSEADPFKLFKEYEAAGIMVYHELRELWYVDEEDKIDVLVAYSMDRLGRSSTLLNMIIENTILNGIKIHLLEDGGMITKDDFRYKAPIGSIAVTVPMDTFRDKAHQAKLDLIRRGLPTGSKVPLSHTRVRDPISGETIALVINEEKKPFFKHIAELLLQKLPWSVIGIELYRQHGYTAPRSRKPFESSTLYDIMHNPFLWGHSADRYRKEAHKHSRGLKGEWVFEEGPPVPPTVTIYYNHPDVPAMYAGDLEYLAAPLKAELKRRMNSKGKWEPRETYRFSRLCVCGTCGEFMSVYTEHGKRTGLRCAQMYRPATYAQCTQRGVLKTDFLTSEVASMLDRWLEDNAVFVDPSRKLPVERKSVQIAQQIARLNAQIEKTIEEQSAAPEILNEHYRAKIKEFAQQLKSLSAQLTQAHEQESIELQNLVLHQHTLDEIRAMTPAKFWSLPDSDINQKLHLLLGDWRFIVTPKGIGLIPRRIPR